MPPHSYARVKGLGSRLKHTCHVSGCGDAVLGLSQLCFKIFPLCFLALLQNFAYYAPKFSYYAQKFPNMPQNFCTNAYHVAL